MRIFGARGFWLELRHRPRPGRSSTWWSPSGQSCPRPPGTGSGFGWVGAQVRPEASWPGHRSVTLTFCEFVTNQMTLLMLSLAYCRQCAGTVEAWGSGEQAKEPSQLLQWAGFLGGCHSPDPVAMVSMVTVISSPRLPGVVRWEIQPGERKRRKRTEPMLSCRSRFHLQ